MRKFALTVVLFFVAAVPRMFAQEFTGDQIMAKLDEKAKAFKSVQSSIEHQKVSLGRPAALDSGTFAMESSKGSPKVMLDFVTPLAIRRRLDDGKATIYNVVENTYQEYKYNPKSEKLGFLMMGWGTPVASIKKGYTAAAKGREPMKGVNAVILELTSLDKSDEYPILRLWLDPQQWTPLQIRLIQVENKYEEFRYSNVKVNQSMPGSAFDLKMRPGARKQ